MVQVQWTARLSDQLGSFTGELIHAGAAHAMEQALPLAMLTASCAVAEGALVHVVGPDEGSLRLARQWGVQACWTMADLPPLAFDAVIDATNDAGVPAKALDLVEPCYYFPAPR